MKVRSFEQVLKNEFGGIMGEGRVHAIQKGLYSVGLLERRNEEISCEGASWFLYASIFAPSSNYNYIVSWLRERKTTLHKNSPFAAFWALITEESLQKSLKYFRVDKETKRVYVKHGGKKLVFAEDPQIPVRRGAKATYTLNIKVSFFRLLGFYLEGAKKKLPA